MDLGVSSNSTARVSRQKPEARNQGLVVRCQNFPFAICHLPFVIFHNFFHLLLGALFQ